MRSASAAIVLLAACRSPEPEPPRPDQPGVPAIGTAPDAPPPWPAEVWVLPAVTVVDADGARGPVWVVYTPEGIVAVLDQQPTFWPTKANVLDARGTFVTPGLIDPHVHLALSGASVDVGPTMWENLRAQLWFGVTTVVDAGGPAAQSGLGRQAASPGWQGPDVLLFSPFLTAAGSHPCEIWNDPHRCWFVDGEAAGRAAADRAADLGFFGLKVAYTDAGHTPWPTPRVDPIAARAGITQGERRGLVTMAHADTPEEATAAAEMGVDHLAHLPFGGVPTVEQSRSLATLRSVHTTFSAFDGTERAVAGSVPWQTLSPVTPAAVLADWRVLSERPELFVPRWIDENRAWAATSRASYAALRAQGTTILPASDAGYLLVPHGYGLHQELAALVDLGLSPTESLVAATAGAADALGLADRGRVRAGLRADLLVVGEDPRLDVGALQDVRWVIARGRAWTRAEIASGWRPADPPIVEDAGGFCMEGAGCASGACDPVAWTCAASCPEPGAVDEPCGPDATCVAGAGGGVCVQVRACDLLDPQGTCEPGWYGEACVPYDRDTAGCWPAGTRGEGESCGYLVPSTFCAQGLYCSSVDNTCYRPCDPARPAAACGPRACWPVNVDGRPWFGVCAR